MSSAKTPEDLTITPRDRRFGRNIAQRRWWLNDDPVATAFYNALSVTFPKGEAYFVESVRAHREGTPPGLEGEINAFIRQEVNHSREHVAFNRHVTDQGYDVRRLDADVDAALALTKGRPPIANLAATMALEHFTAMLAHELLANPRHLDGADPEAARMWRWHAVEEIEHKGVAYDTWLHATRHWPKRRRWFVRALVMLRTTKRFVHGRTRGVLELLRQDGLSGPRLWGRMFHYALVSPGIVRRIGPAWLGYFRPGFHPWQHDDRRLIASGDGDVLPQSAAEPA
ncbi:hypothetical protein FHS96_004131 [Sphingomonas zeicaulis]|uniref:metal-dependent hydrolase n=1 Tax=Sphingomonas zeicaulis TaxID=1632740 RepID=UPI003D1D2D10